MTPFLAEMAALAVGAAVVGCVAVLVIRGGGRG